MPEKVDDYITKGRTSMNLRQYEKAIEWLDKALELDSKNITVMHNKGRCLFLLEQYEQAIEWFDKALELDAKNIMILRDIGNCFMKLERYEQAIEWLDKALELDSNDINVMQNKGYSLILLEQYDQAIECFKKILELNPRYSFAWYNIACAEALRNEAKNALKSLKNAIMLDEINNKRMARDDPNFNNIKNLKEFEDLLNIPVGYKDLKSEQSQALEELEKLIGQSIPRVEKFGIFTFGITTEENNVTGLAIHQKNLSTLPESIGNLTSLQILDLRMNKLFSLPESIGHLTSLEYLSLNSNNLTTLPESIGNLTFLKNLNLYGNELMCLPESIGNLSSLEIINLDNNRLSYLPESIGNLTSLKSLSSYYNNLTYLPESIGNLSSLERLLLSDSQLTTLPESFSQLRSLKYVKLSENNWAGEWEEIAKDDIPYILKLCRKLNGISLFISHAMKDEQTYRILELNKFLENNVIVREKEMDMNIVHNAIICEEDLVEDIWEFMTENIPKSQLLIYIATFNSLRSEACHYELFLANKNDIEILPIKGMDITWENLKKIELINRDKEFKGYLDLSTPRKKFEFVGNNFDDICEKISEYLKKHESEFKKIKKEIEQLENTKKNIIDALHSKEFQDLIKENNNFFDMIFQNISKNKITGFEYLLKLKEFINRKE